MFFFLFLLVAVASSSVVYQQGVLGSLCLYRILMVTISLWDNLTFKLWVFLASTNPEKKLSTEPQACTGQRSFRSTHQDENKPHMPPSLNEKGRNQPVRDINSSCETKGWVCQESDTRREDGGNFTNPSFLHKMMAKWKNNGSGIIGLLAQCY